MQVGLFYTFGTPNLCIFCLLLKIAKLEGILTQYGLVKSNLIVYISKRSAWIGKSKLQPMDLPIHREQGEAPHYP